MDTLYALIATKKSQYVVNPIKLQTVWKQMLCVNH